jgi:hypothetical protein
MVVFITCFVLADRCMILNVDCVVPYKRIGGNVKFLYISWSFFFELFSKCTYFAMNLS